MFPRLVMNIELIELIELSGVQVGLKLYAGFQNQASAQRKCN